MKGFAQTFTGGLQIHQQRQVVTVGLPVVVGQVDAQMPCNGDQMNLQPAGTMIIVGGLEAPIAEFRTIAFSKAGRFMMSDGFRSCQTISTIRLPVR